MTKPIQSASSKHPVINAPLENQLRSLLRGVCMFDDNKSDPYQLLHSALKESFQGGIRASSRVILA